jgi:3-deoxy-manno-octulosonate cytidylyltransferase (CMP-KDO synthetase)
MKIVAVIPAHLASVRFPRKILFPFHGLPMIEHVRRRALLSSAASDVIVATCDEEIATVVRGFGGKVIMTANTHTTSHGYFC